MASWRSSRRGSSRHTCWRRSIGEEAGDVGVVVDVFPGRGSVPPGYMIEFRTLTGDTVAVVDLTADIVRPVNERDMPQARAMVPG